MAGRGNFNLWVTVLPLAVLGVSFFSLRRHFPMFAGDTSNYELVYPHPRVWQERPHTPFTLFLFEHAETGAKLRGATNQVTSNVNPTPELDTDGIAQYYVDTTRQNQPEWTVERLPDIQAQSLEFSAIKRSRTDKIVVTAFSVRGNTTLVLSLALDKSNAKEYEAMMQEFRSFLDGVRLVPAQPETEETQAGN